jgi:hypothetical protein
MKKLFFTIAVLLITATICKAVVTGISGFYRVGQVFLTWNKVTGNSIFYKVYRSNEFISGTTNLSACEYLGKTDSMSAKDFDMSVHDETDVYFRIDSAGPRLSSGSCLFVATTLSDGAYFYAVTVETNGIEDMTILPGSNTLSIPLTETVMTPLPVFQEQRSAEGIPYDIYAYFFSTRINSGQQVLKQAGFFGSDFAVLRNNTPGLHPLRVKFHGGGVDFLSGITTTQEGEIILSCEDNFPSGETSAWWGTNENFDIYSAKNNVTPPASGINYSYTLRRLSAIIDWTITHLPVDTNRIYMDGVSFGAPGAYFYTITYPEKIAASKISVGVYDFSFQNDYQLTCSLNPGKKNRKSGNSRFGTVSTNLMSDFGYSTYKMLNGGWMIHQFNTKSYPVMYCINGKRDNLMGWSEKPVYYDSINANHIGGYYFWDNREHGGNGKTWEINNFDLYRYRKNLSFPAFSNCSLNEDYGTGNGAVGPEFGTVNGSLDWKNEVYEDTSNWVSKIFVRNLIKGDGSILVYPDSCTVSITPRRLQLFNVTDSIPVNWAVIHNHQLIQSGMVMPVNGLITISGIKIFRDTSTVLLNTGQALDTFYVDLDGDGFGNASSTTISFNTPEGYSAISSDCNDTVAAMYPGAMEFCNYTDDNCDGILDSLLYEVFYADTDNDGYGNPMDSIIACFAIPGYTYDYSDCNDTSAAINPMANELCNNIDDNCDGITSDPIHTYYLDFDHDGFGSFSDSIFSCEPIAGYAINHTDCNDLDTLINPGTSEICNGVDDDCNGAADNVLIEYYLDNDSDGFAGTPELIASCIMPSGYASSLADCDDEQPSVFPGTVDICNGIDDNCNAAIDENQLYPVATVSGSTEICMYDTLLLTALPDTLGLAFQWTLNNTAIVGATNNQYLCTEGGDYAVMVSNGICMATSSIKVITVHSPPVVTVTPSDTSHLCKGTTMVLTANAGTGLTYQWHKNNLPISGKVKTTYTVPKNDAGSYSVSVTDGFGCSDTSDAAIVNKINKPAAVITVTGEPDLCSTGSVLLQVSGQLGYSYKWSKDDVKIPNETNQTFTASSAGSYTVKVTENIVGCNKTSAPVLVFSSCKLSAERQPADLTAFIECHPNPSPGLFKLKVNNVQTNSSGFLEIMGLHGSVVYAEEINLISGSNEYQVLLPASCTTGSYLLLLTINNEKHRRLLTLVE